MSNEEDGKQLEQVQVCEDGDFLMYGGAAPDEMPKSITTAIVAAANLAQGYPFHN